MFAYRRNTQKPDEELYAAFKQSFPEVGPGSSSTQVEEGGLARRSSTLSEAIIDEPVTAQQYVWDYLSSTPLPPLCLVALTVANP